MEEGGHHYVSAQQQVEALSYGFRLCPEEGLGHKPQVAEGSPPSDLRHYFLLTATCCSLTTHQTVVGDFLTRGTIRFLNTYAGKFIRPHHKQIICTSKVERIEDALKSCLESRELMVGQGSYKPSKRKYIQNIVAVPL